MVCGRWWLMWSRNLRPRIATRNKWARIEALLRNRAFATEYAVAREKWRDGAPAVFPTGTYWLQRFASVPVSKCCRAGLLMEFEAA
jgi:hypothetical protein